MAATTWNQGWGEGAWGYNAWSGVSPAYEVDGVSGAGDVGSVLIRIDDTIPAVGVAGTSTLGTITIRVTSAAVGVVGTGALGVVTIGGWSIINAYQNVSWGVINDT